MYYSSLLTSYLVLVICVCRVVHCQLVVQSEKLIGLEECTASQQRQIVEAWHDAMTIADVVYHAGVHFDRVWAEPDFFGPESLNKDDQNNIRAVLLNAHTFKLASDPKIRPDEASARWGAWEINVRCDDWRKKCQGGAAKQVPAAYTDNPGKDNSKDTINFCAQFFEQLKPCTEVLEKWGKSHLMGEKEDLTNYQCRGYAALHELFHLDNESKVGSQGHIFDRKFNYQQEYDNRFVYKSAYGPYLTRIFGRYPNKEVGKLTGTNADSLAQYSLAKWVEVKTGYYPRFPSRGDRVPNPSSVDAADITFVNDKAIINETAIAIKNSSPLIAIDDFIQELCSEFNEDGTCYSTPEDPNLPVTFTSLSPLDTRREEDNRVVYGGGYQSFDSPPYRLPDDPYLECRSGISVGSQERSSVGQLWAQDRIAEFCQLIKGIPVDGLSNSYVTMAYPTPTPEKSFMWLSAGWQKGDTACSMGRTLDEEECLGQLGVVLNGCDTGSIVDKYGGIRVNNCIAWMMIP